VSIRTRTGLVLAMGLQRLVELRISARNRTVAGHGEQASPSTYPVMVAVHVALFAESVWPRPARRIPRALEFGALIGLAASAGLRVWVICTLGANRNVMAHVRQGYAARMAAKASSCILCFPRLAYSAS
jgi:isoprenylcysteine carboxyl methyltransferase (ICMT) family protein YpbQ